MTTALRQRMHQDLQLAGLSERTQEAYLRAVRQLADHFHTRPDRLSEQQVRDYLLHLKNDRNFASASLIIACCGIKFFYSHTMPRDWPTLKRLRVRGTRGSRRARSMKRGVSSMQPPPQPGLFWTVYSLGLRLGKGCTSVGDIDSARMMVRASRQGGQDRYVPFPSTLKSSANTG